VTTEPRAAPGPGAGRQGAGRQDAGLPRWAAKPVRRLTAGELAEALHYLERHRPDDDVLGRALAGEFARRTAAAEFADRTAEFADRAAATAPTAPQVRPRPARDDGGAAGHRGTPTSP
jgi:hypothetical protein